MALQNKRTLRILIVLTIVMLLCIVAVPYYQRRAIDRTAETMLRTFYNAQEAYFKDHRYYALDMSDLGVDLRLDNFTFYTDDTPDFVKNEISEADRPFLNRSGYRVILRYSKSNKDSWLWLGDQDGNVDKIR